MTTLADSAMSENQAIRVTPKLNLLIDRGEDSQFAHSLPEDVVLHKYARHCLEESKAGLPGKASVIEVSVQCLNPSEMQELNEQYRGKPQPTNVLSFPAEIPVLDVQGEQSSGLLVLGDLVFCEAVVQQEAQEQHKALVDHWAHIFIHGMLHLLGYDHEVSEEAELMESLETHILSTFNIKNPYLVYPK